MGEIVSQNIYITSYYFLKFLEVRGDGPLWNISGVLLGECVSSKPLAARWMTHRKICFSGSEMPQKHFIASLNELISPMSMTVPSTHPFCLLPCPCQHSHTVSMCLCTRYWCPGSQFQDLQPNSYLFSAPKDPCALVIFSDPQPLVCNHEIPATTQGTSETPPPLETSSPLPQAVSATSPSLALSYTVVCVPLAFLHQNTTFSRA